MPIPSTRSELLDLLQTTYAKLRDEVARGGDDAGHLHCVDGWTVRDLLSVRTWWTHAVVRWIEAGREGLPLTLPAEGYRWNETPRLNADIVAGTADEPYASVLLGLDEGFEAVLSVIESLNDSELLEVGAFEWAGKWPLSRWISMNTARQYATARTYLRRALAKGGGEMSRRDKGGRH